MFSRIGRASGVLLSLVRPLDCAVFIPALGVVVAAFLFVYAGMGGGLRFICTAIAANGFFRRMLKRRYV